MNKSKLTRTLMAACSIVALSAVMYGCVHSGDDPAPTVETPDPDTALGAARQAASVAAGVADIAADAAEMAVSRVMANSDADTASYAVAQNAATRARAAADAAEMANRTAAAATDTAAAEAARDRALAKQMLAADERANAEKFAGMVGDAAQEASDLNEARMAANTAATAAGTAATVAETAARTVAGLVGADDDQTKKADVVAMDARMAATAARTASEAARDAMESGVAVGHKMTAESQQATAEGKRDEAAELQREAQIASKEGDERETKQIADARTAAETAATSARTAATDAASAANAAEMARDGRATIQTGDLMDGNSGDLAMTARGHADDADTAAKAAEAAFDDADAATTVVDAVTAKLEAENQRPDAEMSQVDAEMAGDDVLEAVKSELFIGIQGGNTVANVGDTSIAVDATTVTGPSTATPGTQTGFILNVVDTGGGQIGVVLVNPLPTGTPPVAGNLASPAVLPRPINIGVTYDSTADDARLTLITNLASSSPRAGQAITGTYADIGPPTTTGSAANTVDHDGRPSSLEVPLFSASGAFLSNGNTLGQVDGKGTIAANATLTTLYYYDSGSLDSAATAQDESRGYLRLVSTTVTGTGASARTSYTYQPVTVGGGVTIPTTVPYTHVNYGLWNSLTPSTTATNVVTNLGIGFVDALSTGDDMTGDMPTFGDAIYTGNWIANVRARNTPSGANGAITSLSGGAIIAADFQTDALTATLATLATLTGEISGNEFSGTAAPVVAAAPVGSLNATGTFTGSFSGAFFGPEAAEVGGVFDYSSASAGAFRGSFGGAQDPEGGVD